MLVLLLYYWSLRHVRPWRSDCGLVLPPQHDLTQAALRKIGLMPPVKQEAAGRGAIAQFGRQMPGGEGR